VGRARKAATRRPLHAFVERARAVGAILDAAEAGTGPEQIEMAVQQAVERGLADSQRMKEEAEGYSRRVRRLVQGALDSLPS
jgi:hypothetical protein